MNLKLILQNKEKFFFFLLLFSLNLAFKEVFNFLGGENAVYDIVFILFFICLSVVCLLFSVNLIKQYPAIYLASVYVYIYFFISSFATINPTYGVQKSFLGILLPLTVFSLFTRIKWTKELILNCFVGVTILLSLIAILFKLKNGFLERSVPFGVLGPIPFGWVNGFTFFIIGFKKIKKLPEYLFMVFFVTMILWTGSKGPFLALIVVLFFNFNAILGGKKSTKIITLILLLIIVYIINIYAEDIRAIQTFLAFFEDPEEYTGGVGYGSFGARFDYFTVAYNMFLDSPIFGNGFGSFIEHKLLHKYPHNVYIELLSETGLVGFGFIFYIIFKNSFKSLGQGVIFILICLSFSGDFSYFRYAFYPLLISTYCYIDKD